VLVKSQCIVNFQPIDMLPEASRHGQTRWTHPIRHHENQVALAARLVLRALIAMLPTLWRLSTLMLYQNGEYNYGCCSCECPYQEPNLAPETVAIAACCSAPRWLV
jgi:hypothetical protein